MDLNHPGWLQEVLASILAGYDPARGEERISRGVVASEKGRETSPKGRVRLHLEEELRRTGLVYGFPKLPTRVSAGRRLGKDEAHYLAVLANKSFLALDVARLLGIPHERARAEAELTMLLAATVGRQDLAEKIHESIILNEFDKELPTLQVLLEKALQARIPPVSGDIRFDLPLHNGMAFGEARVMGHLAFAYFNQVADEDGVGGDPQMWQGGRVERFLGAVNRERLFLIEALVSHAAEQGRLTDQQRRMMRRELKRFRLGRGEERRMRRVITEPQPLLTLAERVRTRSLRRFILEQLVLTTMIDGAHPSNRSVDELADAFQVSRETLEGMEAEVAEYVHGTEDVFDAFEGRAAAKASSGKWGVDRIVEEINLNIGRINQEMRETGELTQLLAKAAMGQRLSREEKGKVKEQLLDLAKVVPSLAILAAPGGTVILAVLLKVLPFSLLPSSFQTRPEAPPPPRPLRRRAGG